MKLWTANLGRGVTAAEFTRNLNRVLDAGGPRAVYAFQEIDEADKPDEAALIRRLTKDTHRIAGPSTAVPILIPRHLDLIGVTITPGCPGLAKFTPNRPIVEALIRLPSGLEVVGLNFHVPIDREQTRTRRAQVRAKARARARHHADQGRGGWWTADTNTRTRWPRIAPAEVEVLTAGIDRVKAWPATGTRVEVTGRHNVDLTIDGHNAHGASIRWAPR